MKTRDLANMIRIEDGMFTMGSEAFYPEEAPRRKVYVDGFWIDEAPVTNAQFAEFVAATGYVTFAEIAPDPEDYPGILPSMVSPGSLVFTKPSGLVDMTNPGNWWRFTFGACWNHPLGPDSDLAGLQDHPVVHVAYADAQAYAQWAGKTLPTEAEFEFAARGGLEDAEYAWGNELEPDGRMMANYWQGLFPLDNLLFDGWEGTSPVRSYEANGYGLYDMVGNTWEWTSDWWAEKPGMRDKKGPCCAISKPRGGNLEASYDPGQPSVRIGRKVLKGGSHLCSANYCQRYRPAARQPEMIDTSTTHIGFRCVVR